MRELNVVKSTKKPITVETIRNDLKKLGVNNVNVLLVHSSLSSIGWVCGGSQAVIMALLQSVSDQGTLVMPAHSSGISDPADWENPPVPQYWFADIYNYMPAFELLSTPSTGVGKIAELFRTSPNTIRSNHPQTSFCANGVNAKLITENHPLTPQYGINSPLGKMYKLNAKVLLLGIGYESCTSFHLSEAMNEKMPKKRMGAALIDNGVRVWQWFEDFDYDSDDFELIGKEFEKSHDVSIGMIGNAESRLFDMKSGIDFAKEWLLKNRLT